MGIFSDINEVQLLGNTTNEPDIKYTPSGTAVAVINVATNRDYKKDEKWEKETTFHRVVLWGKLAESAKERLNKGTRVLIKGRNQVRTWEDKNGEKKYSHEIVANEMILIDRYNKKSGTPHPAEQEDYSEGDEGESIDPNDLPF